VAELKEIFCQDKAISILQRAFAADKVPHAYIFAGLDGIGKSKTARQWAKLLLCKKPDIENNFADSCGRCQSCLLFEAGSHPDFNLVYKELREFTENGKGKDPPIDFPIDVIREFVVEKISTKPVLSQRKVFVITEAEKLNTESQNALLKTLEEPPYFCSIILICTSLEKLLPTTRSRCQTIRFSPVSEDHIIKKLEQMGVSEKQAKYFARFSQGSIGFACQLAQIELAEPDPADAKKGPLPKLYETKKEIIDSIVSLKYADSLELAEQFLDKSREIAKFWGRLDDATSTKDINRRSHKVILQIIISALTDVMKFGIVKPQDIINFDQQDKIGHLTARLAPEQAAEKIADTYKSMQLVDASVNERLIFEQLLLNLAVSDIINVSQ
jgi:DNA polymerase III delta' subunit